MAALCEFRKLSVSSSESKARVLVRYGRVKLMYLKVSRVDESGNEKRKARLTL